MRADTGERIPGGPRRQGEGGGNQGRVGAASGRSAPGLPARLSRREGLEHFEVAAPAMRTAGSLDAGHAVQERLNRLDHGRLRLGCLQRGARRRQAHALVRRAEQAVVADALEAGRGAK